LDDELMDEIRKTLPDDLPHVFISAVSGLGIQELKDVLWGAITDDRNRLATPSITHRPLDGHHRVREEDELIFENEPVEPEEDEFEEEWDDEDDYNEDWEYGVNDPE
ncbi:MAG: GTPase Obg, partial [Paramuribaculum sp.]|nr:GTPase Obg [Paramuribaculum sp.]